jgi:NAD(P)-dependent dehydrogenase (short-subunit alcohol dehydrogenase family)/acyl carrier protein
VAACIAGVFCLEDGLKLIATRGKLMATLADDGAMIAVRTGETEVRKLLDGGFPGIAIAALNGPDNTVVSGKESALVPFLGELERQGIRYTRLKVSRAFHSPEMAPMLGEFAKIARSVPYSPPKIPLVSLVTGQTIGEEIAQSDYWCGHILEPVRFAEGIEAIDQLGYRVYLEIGAKPILAAMGQTCIGEERLWLPSLHPERGNLREMLGSLAQLYCRGVKVDWRGVDGELSCRRVSLPTYPFDRQRFWHEPKSTPPQKESTLATTPILEALQKGDTETLLSRLTATENLSDGEKQVLPKLLDLLVREHRQCIDSSLLQEGLYEIQWRPVEIPPSAGLKSERWLIVADNQGIGENLAQYLQGKNDRCFLVYPEEEFRDLGQGRYGVNFQQSDALSALGNHIGQGSLGIIDLLSLNHTGEEDLDAQAMQEIQLFDSVRLLALARFLSERDGETSNRLWVVTRRGIESPKTSVSPISGAIWGLGKTLALDYPTLWGGTIDLDEQPLEENTLARIFTHSWCEGLVIRDGQTYVPRLVRSSLDFNAPLILQADVTYVITGGLGGLGWQVVNRFVERGAKSLVILGRGEPSPARVASIERFRAAGVQVRFFCVDVADEESLGEVLAKVNSSLPPIRGIIHAAGRLNPQPNPTPERESIERILRPKVMGGWNLHRLTLDLPLDFFVTFSSIASVWGSKGQAEYAAANSFLDRLAHYRRQRGLTGASINWGPWKGEGMASEERREWLNRRGIRGLEPDIALNALEAILQGRNIQITVADVDWPRFQEIYESVLLDQRTESLGLLPASNRLFAEIFVPHSEKVIPVARVTPFQQAIASVSPNQYQTFLQDYLSVEVTRVMGSDPSHCLIDPGQGFFDLGMDSLMVIELKNRLEKAFGSSLPSTIGFEFPTILALSEYIATQVLKWDTTSSNEQIVFSPLDASESLLNSWDEEALTEDEIEASLQQELLELQSLLRDDGNG